LKTVYFQDTGYNLPIYGIPQAKLKDFETSKKDMKKGAEIIPEENYRITNEDLF